VSALSEDRQEKDVHETTEVTFTTDLGNTADGEENKKIQLSLWHKIPSGQANTSVGCPEQMAEGQISLS